MNRMTRLTSVMLLVVGAGIGGVVPVESALTPEAQVRSQAIRPFLGDRDAERSDVQGPKVADRSDEVQAPRGDGVQAPRRGGDRRDEVEAPRGA